MAIALVQAGTLLDVTSATSGTITLTGVTAGNLLTVVVDDVDGNTVTFSVSDDKGNTWLSAVSNDNSGYSSAILYCLSAAAGTTVITITASGSTNFVAQAQEWSGGTWTLDTTSSIDESATTSHVCSASSSVIDTNGADVVICNSVVNNGSSFGTRTAGSGYTAFSGTGASSGLRTMWQYQIFSTAQANERGAFTTTNSKATAACIAAFKCALAASGCWWPCCTSPTSSFLYTIFFGNKAGAVRLSSVEQYTPSPTNTWATMTSGSPARDNASTASLSGAAYTFGGVENSSPFYMTDNDEYVTDVWTAKTNMPSPSRFEHEGMTVGSYCYSVYGNDGASNLRDADQYDPSGNSWASKTDGPTSARILLGAAGIGSKGYTWGGFDGAADMRDCEEYDPSGNTWTSKTDMPTPARSGCGGFDISSDGYATGGSGGAVLKDTDKYTPAGDSWVNDTDMPAEHQWTGDESNGSVGYSTNGQNFGGSRTLDHYGFAAGSPGTWSTLTNCSGDARQYSSAGFA